MMILSNLCIAILVEQLIPKELVINSNSRKLESLSKKVVHDQWEETNAMNICSSTSDK